MTFTVATITESFALLSQDTFVSDMSAAGGIDQDFPITHDLATAAASAFVSHGHGVQPSLFASERKLIELPGLRMVAAGSGSLLMHLVFATDLRGWEHFGERIDLFKLIPHNLSMRRAELRSRFGNLGYMAILVGWDRELDGPVGFAFSSADDFRPVPIGIGHTVMPVPAVDDPDYPDLYERWEPATRGVETEAFHVMLAENARRSCRRGLFRPGVGIGGELHTARVDRDGPAVRMTHRFPPEEEAA